MKIRRGSFWLPMIAFCAILAGCPGKSETGAPGAGKAIPGGDQAAPQGMEMAYPVKPDTGLSREALRGKALYGYYCALCHGKEGNADGFNAFNLKTPPAKHTDPVIMGTLSDAQIRRVIKDGGTALGRSPLMPPWGGVFNERQIADLASFVRTLSRK